MSIADVEEELLSVARRFRLVRIAFDPWQMSPVSSGSGDTCP